MTSQSSSTKGTRIMPLVLNTLKRKWTTMLLIAIIMFFALPVPLMMLFSDAKGMTGIDRLERIKHISQNWASEIRLPLVPILSVLAVVMSCVVLRYLHKKVSVDFYHSLPIKRSKLFVAQLLTGCIALLLPTLIMFAAALLVIASNGGMTGAILISALYSLLEAIIFTLLFYGLASLVGVVTGVTAVHLILTGVAIFIVPLIYVVTVAFCSIFVENMWVDWYLDKAILSELSPVIRFIAYLENRMTLTEGVLYLLFAVGFFFAAYLVYRHYKSERAEISVIFPALGEVIKYAVVFPATLGGGLIFYYMMRNGFWTIFGMVCGGLLTFMLANTILNKSAKAMFRRWKGLIVYAGVCVLMMVVAFNNVFGMNTSVPTSLSKVEAEFDDNTGMMRFTDKKVMEALRQFNEKGRFDTSSAWEYGRYVEITDEDGESVENIYLIEQPEQLNLKIVYYPKFGLPVAKWMIILDKNTLAGELKTVLDSEEFSKQYQELANSVERNSSAYFMAENIGNDALFKAGIEDALKKDAGKVNFDYFQKLNLGFLSVRTRDVQLARVGMDFINYWLSFPITTASENMIEVLGAGRSIDDILSDYADSIEKITVYDSDNDKSTTYSSIDEKKAIIESLAMIGSDEYGSKLCQFTLTEPRYYVAYKLEREEGYSETYVDVFRLGQIPDFIK